MPESIKPLFIQWIRDLFYEENGKVGEEIEKSEQELKRIDKKLENLLDMRLNSEISKEEYAELKQDLLKNKENRELTIKRYTTLDNDLLDKAERCFELVVNLSHTYLQANILKKVDIIKMICFELLVDTKKSLYIAENELFKEIKKLGNTEWLG